MNKPIIGITLDLVDNCNEYNYSSFPFYALRTNYADVIAQAGGVAVMIPYQKEYVQDILDLLDGLVIPGSDLDIHPKFYGQQITQSQVAKDDSKTHFEFLLLERALKLDMPFLGICHGAQLLNVLLGGDLLQDIQDNVSSGINHKDPKNKHKLSHTINITNDTTLFRLFKQSQCLVNSYHHQAINKLGYGLIASAIAPDGITEAVESTHHKFTIGVQWHPEHLAQNVLDDCLFESFINAAITYRDKKTLVAL